MGLLKSWEGPGGEIIETAWLKFVLHNVTINTAFTHQTGIPLHAVYFHLV